MIEGALSSACCRYNYKWWGKEKVTDEQILVRSADNRSGVHFLFIAVTRLVLGERVNRVCLLPSADALDVYRVQQVFRACMRASINRCQVRHIKAVFYVYDT